MNWLRNLWHRIRIWWAWWRKPKRIVVDKPWVLQPTARRRFLERNPTKAPYNFAKVKARRKMAKESRGRNRAA